MPPAPLSKSWPPVARDVLLDAARFYYQQMKEPWPVPDAAMNRAIGWANEELAKRQEEIYEDASARWINRWESGTLDSEMKRAIEETYRRLSRAEGAIRPPKSAKRSQQLDAEIAQALSARRR